MRVGPGRVEIYRTPADGGDQQLLSTIEHNDREGWLPDHRWFVRGTSLLASFFLGSEAELWSIDINSGEAFPVPVGSKETARSDHPVGSNGVEVLVADLDAIGSRDPARSADYFSIIEVPTGRRTALPPLDGYTIVSASMSPLGGLVAIIGVADRGSVANDAPERAVLGVSTTTAVRAGLSDWSTQPVGPTSGSAHPSSPATAVTSSPNVVT